MRITLDTLADSQVVLTIEEDYCGYINRDTRLLERANVIQFISTYLETLNINAAENASREPGQEESPN